ncbi:MAG: hypothetical protein AAFV53_27605, partial [Myxococcota bacterium]
MAEGDETTIWRATGWTLIARVSPLLMGPVTALLVAFMLSPIEQGMYYAAASLVRWQILLELGFGVTLRQRVSWHHAQADPQADARLSGLLRIGVFGYLLMTAVWLLFATWGGGMWLQTQVDDAWLPWLLVSILVGLSFPIQAGLS